MLIFPINDKPSWRHPPVLSICLILINICVFLFYQGNDQEKIEKLTQYYLENDLYRFEQDLADDYFQTAFSEDILLSEFSEAEAAQIIIANPDFDSHVRDHWASMREKPQGGTTAFDKWQEKRKTLEENRNKLSSIEFGLRPAEASWYSFISYAFLHGSWDHLIGNMAFLFLFGFVLERVLGRHLYLLLYITSGAASGGFYFLLNQQSTLPLIGASGAVSGLMGGYIAYYGLKRIRFFYTIAFYFGECKAPAIAVLPLWLAKEIYGHFFLEDQVAYSAHFGGLVSGALLVFVFRFLNLLATTNSIEESAKTEQEPEEVRQSLELIQGYMENLRFDEAETAAQKLLRNYPSLCSVIRCYFNVLSVRPERSVFHNNTFALLKNMSLNPKLGEEHIVLIEDILREYEQCSAKAPVLKHGGLMSKLSAILFEHQHYAFASALLERAIHTDPRLSNLKAPLSLAIKYHQTKQNIAEAHRLSLILNRMSA